MVGWHNKRQVSTCSLDYTSWDVDFMCMLVIEVLPKDLLYVRDLSLPGPACTDVWRLRDAWEVKMQIGGPDWAGNKFLDKGTGKTCLC